MSRSINRKRCISEIDSFALPFFSEHIRDRDVPHILFAKFLFPKFIGAFNKMGSAEIQFNLRSEKRIFKKGAILTKIRVYVHPQRRF